MSEADEFAVDAPVAPGRDLGGHRDDKAPQLGRGSGAPWRPVGLGPVSGDAAAVPAKEGVGGDEPTGPSSAGSDAAIVPRSVRSSLVSCGLSALRRRTAS